MTAPLNLIGPQVRKFRTGKNWTQEALATKLQGEGWDVSRESIAKLEAQFRRAPDCELLFLSKVLDVAVLDLFPARLNLKKLDRSLRLKVSTFTGHLATAEAIYDGPHDNLVGIETFSGSVDNKSPQHAVLLGMSGAGSISSGNPSFY
jgi:transcriptional regulator with XRE-family HTH domain